MHFTLRCGICKALFGRQIMLTVSNIGASIGLNNNNISMQLPTWSASTMRRNMADQNDYNRQLIEEFRANRGRSGQRANGLAQAH